MASDELLPEPPQRERILRDWYAASYNCVASTADGSFITRYMHGGLERRHPATEHFGRVLEVGANRGEHLAYVRHGYDSYVMTDLEAPPVAPEVMAGGRVEVAAADVTALPYADRSFDRAVSTCVLHHVDSPLQAALELRRVTRDGGCVSVLIPTDPGLAYRFGKAVTSGRSARRQGIGELHDLVSALDHRNHFRSIRTQLDHVFRDDAPLLRWYPWRFPGMELNAFVVFEARVRR
jgi:SAM-dependent methyltransferase